VISRPSRAFHEISREPQAIAARAALGAQTGATANLARLLVKLADAHLFLDAAAFDQFAEPPDGLLGRFSIA
jgi:hypothetical protein